MDKEQKQIKKRTQVKVACAHCRKCHLACDPQRPCKQCLKHGVECIDTPRKKQKTDHEGDQLKAFSFDFTIDLNVKKERDDAILGDNSITQIDMSNNQRRQPAPPSLSGNIDIYSRYDEPEVRLIKPATINRSASPRNIQINTLNSASNVNTQFRSPGKPSSTTSPPISQPARVTSEVTKFKSYDDSVDSDLSGLDSAPNSYPYPFPSIRQSQPMHPGESVPASSDQTSSWVQPHQPYQPQLPLPFLKVKKNDPTENQPSNTTPSSSTSFYPDQYSPSSSSSTRYGGPLRSPTQVSSVSVQKSNFSSEEENPESLRQLVASLKKTVETLQNDLNAEKMKTSQLEKKIRELSGHYDHFGHHHNSIDDGGPIISQPPREHMYHRHSNPTHDYPNFRLIPQSSLSNYHNPSHPSSSQHNPHITIQSSLMVHLPNPQQQGGPNPNNLDNYVHNNTN
eukprot:TRINITY_DN7646_c0_g1_i1.p1 TRINITY_DN7646_c0_g1~~TRINITY_DN7646_c0_g1_i1.p1  ORF type:complete len:452 (+),score=85.69 TRINITY_DN7646_c0_g1_i1:48-1403(+)